MIKLKYHHDNSHVTVHFGDNWRVHASNELISGLKNLLGYDQVKPPISPRLGIMKLVEKKPSFHYPII